MEKKSFDEKDLEKLLGEKEIDEKLLDEIPDDLLFNDDLDDPILDELGGILGNVKVTPKPKAPAPKKKSSSQTKKKGVSPKSKTKVIEKPTVIKEISAESMYEKLEIIEQDVGDIKHAMTILLSAVSTLSKSVERIEKKVK